MSENLTVFTVAAGNDKYFRMAVGLARSFQIHNFDKNINFIIFTDQQRKLPDDLINIKLNVLPSTIPLTGLDFKVNFDSFPLIGKNIFIDSDCFVLRELKNVFAQFSGMSVGVAGIRVAGGDWCGADLQKVLQLTGFNGLIRFNGGFYYIDMDHPNTSQIFESARWWASRYDELGFERLGCSFNDEPLISLSLAQHDERFIKDDGSIAADLNFDVGSYVDVLLYGATLLNRPIGHLGRKWWYENELVKPSIVHYGSGGFKKYIYVREVFKMKLFHEYKIPRFLVLSIVDPFIRFVYKIWANQKGTTL